MVVFRSLINSLWMRFRRGVTVVLLLSVALGMAVSVLGLYHVAQVSETVVNVGNNITSLSEQEFSASWEVLSSGTVDQSARETLLRLESSWNSAITSAQQTSIWTPTLASATSAFRTDMLQVNEEIASSRGQLARVSLERHAWYEVQAVKDAVSAGIAVQNNAGDRASFYADLETIAIIFALGIIVAMVTQAINRMKVKSALLATEAKSRAESRFRSLVNNSSDILAVLTDTFEIVFVAPSWTRIMGHQINEIIGVPILDFVMANDKELLAAALESAEMEPGSEVLTRWQRADGTWSWMTSSATNLLHDPAVGAIVLNAHDVSGQKELERQLINSVFRDSLSGLANRVLLREHINSAIVRSTPGNPSCLVYLDIDDFKNINDSYNHEVGDELIVSIARRLEGLVDKLDTVARFSGDEFVVLRESGASPVEFAKLLQLELEQAFQLSVGFVYIKVTVSVVRIEYDTTADALLRDADLAMFAAKRDMRSRFALFDSLTHESIRDRIELKNDLTLAVDRDEFFVMYQPIIDLVTRKPVGVEALVRWQHPIRGQVEPLKFIPLAEENRSIISIGRSVINKSVAAIAKMNSAIREYSEPLSLNVNLSLIELEQPDICEFIQDVLAENHFDPKLLIVEVTESICMQDPNSIALRLHNLRSSGIRVAIDDFGTGYSSLSHLENLPVDSLKIDKSFTDHVLDLATPVTLKTVIQLGNELRLKLVAEGIECSGQVEALLKLGCQFGQGFYFAKPMKKEDLQTFLGLRVVATAAAQTRFAPHRLEPEMDFDPVGDNIRER